MKREKEREIEEKKDWKESRDRMMKGIQLRKKKHVTRKMENMIR